MAATTARPIPVLVPRHGIAALQARLEKAARAQQQAESNLAALQTQSRGLENEYDRWAGAARCRSGVCGGPSRNGWQQPRLGAGGAGASCSCLSACLGCKLILAGRSSRIPSAAPGPIDSVHHLRALRLLAEHDELRRQLQRAGLASGGGDSRFGKKDA